MFKKRVQNFIVLFLTNLLFILFANCTQNNPSDSSTTIATITTTSTTITMEPLEKKIGGSFNGSVILGNKNLCLVYKEKSYNQNSNCVQHFYINNFTNDYFISCFQSVIINNNGNISAFSSIGELTNNSQSFSSTQSDSCLEDYFYPVTKFTVNNTGIAYSRTYVLHSGAIIQSIDLENVNNSRLTTVIRFKNINNIPSISIDKNLQSIVLTFPDSQKIYLAYKNSDITYNLTDKIENIFKTNYEENIYTELPFLILYNLNNNSISKDELIIIPETENIQVSTLLSTLRKTDNILSLAKIEWDEWINKGIVPDFTNDTQKMYYKANLSALLGVYLEGTIPADVTGQFVTNGMPQLYPRDALMSARSFYLTGHTDEAVKILNFWNNVKNKTPGEFYARYDAYANAVNAGSGAAYDVPEWDFNGYYTSLCLWLWEKTGIWYGDLTLIEKMMNFLIDKMNENGQILEGGIIEWTGYLPATHMNNIAALWDASVIFSLKGDKILSEKYFNAAKKMQDGLKLLYNTEKNTYMDYRDNVFAFCSSFNFGYLWGYPQHDELKKSNEWIIANRQKNDGGIQYFDATGGVGDYGEDMFFFTTGAAAQYQAECGSFLEYNKMINWMQTSSNIYGMMPERIYYPTSGVSPASPLSWCNGEFVNSLLYGAKKGYLVKENDSTKEIFLTNQINVLKKYISNENDDIFSKTLVSINGKKYIDAKDLLILERSKLRINDPIIDFHINRYLERLINDL